MRNIFYLLLLDVLAICPEQPLRPDLKAELRFGRPNVFCYSGLLNSQR